MEDVAELGRRISAALERIERGIGNMPRPSEGSDETVAELGEALQSEREASAQLAERLRLTRERGAAEAAELKDQVERLTRLLDQQGLEIQRLRRNVLRLRDTVRAVREAQGDGVVNAELINRAMQAELDALHSTRQSEIFEIDEILAELRPLVLEAQDA